MPELPEVETIKRQLTPSVIGKEIISTYVSGKRLRREIPNLEVLKRQKILNIFRRNKYLVFETQHLWMVIHLGMTGKLIVEDIYQLKKHTHFLLSLSNELFISYEDARRFGSLDLFSKEQYPDYYKIPLLVKLGIEPLESDFTIKNITGLILNSSLEIKKFLMDSNIICGLGNIYANEVLFICKIHPKKITKTLSKKQILLLYKEIPLLLEKAISLGGSSISDFVHANGSKGSMQDNYFVYGRDNQMCKLCHTPIEKIFQAGRSSFYCPHCQKDT